ncbi:hypothetical protein CALCODRAFT_516659, partial [Calocera cornea HHB12733]
MDIVIDLSADIDRDAIELTERILSYLRSYCPANTVLPLFAVVAVASKDPERKSILEYICKPGRSLLTIAKMTDLHDGSPQLERIKHTPPVIPPPELDDAAAFDATVLRRLEAYAWDQRFSPVITLVAIVKSDARLDQALSVLDNAKRFLEQEKHSWFTDILREAFASQDFYPLSQWGILKKPSSAYIEYLKDEPIFDLDVKPLALVPSKPPDSVKDVGQSHLPTGLAILPTIRGDG